jgi:hypothetical protein
MASTISAGTTAGTAIAIAGDTSGQLQLQTNGTTTAVTINTAQGVQFLNCIGVGNATPSTSGAGITFPATASLSSDANTLDDYEEGTWTATLIGGTTPPTIPVTTTGKYVKIGKQVLVICGFTNVDTTGASGPLAVTGLPFANDGGVPQVGCPPMLYSLTCTGNYHVWYIASSQLQLYSIANAAGWNQEAISAGTGKYVWASATYITG